MKSALAICAALALAACATAAQDLPGWRLVKMEPYDKNPKCQMAHFINDGVPDTIMTRIKCPTD